MCVCVCGGSSCVCKLCRGSLCVQALCVCVCEAAFPHLCIGTHGCVSCVCTVHGVVFWCMATFLYSSLTQ